MARSGGVFGYQLAVVVDDAAMNITQVVRGHDLDDSTPRQLLIQEALGLPRPEYWHVGLVLGPEGKRLAKRDRAETLQALREAGVTAEAVRKGLGFGPAAQARRWRPCRTLHATLPDAPFALLMRANARARWRALRDLAGSSSRWASRIIRRRSG